MRLSGVANGYAVYAFKEGFLLMALGSILSFHNRFTDDSNAIVVNCYFLITLAAFVFGCGYYDFLNKFVYQFGRESLKAPNLLRFVNKPL